jgi:catechol 2,3-dioxygenase-like lactoylglutathione lyase family enzyme
VIDHVSLQVSDVATSRSFYERLLAPLGLHPFDVGQAVGFSDGIRACFWLSPAQRDAERELHVAFVAPDRAGVVAFGAAAASIGAEILHEPRVFPEYDHDYYGCFVRDPDGHNVEAVCRTPA